MGQEIGILVHAVEATKVAPVGHRKAEIRDVPSKRIDHGLWRPPVRSFAAPYSCGASPFRPDSGRLSSDHATVVIRIIRKEKGAVCQMADKIRLSGVKIRRRIHRYIPCISNDIKRQRGFRYSSCVSITIADDFLSCT